MQDRFQEALKEARVVDELLTARPNVDYWKKNKPLLGVPLSVKESIAVKGTYLYVTTVFFFFFFLRALTTLVYPFLLHCVDSDLSVNGGSN